ncbi:hypothetical protein BCR44DRAFT_1439818 [Catenaria anguillulae PL171]|uniref:Uncharacterized protein n=1 Tax=Catenaria anguillulae PL171 TaxID=765915 RepID=A0A1Y2HFR9_9FUNG|nr:hypothetical protein BCR44DRAFT_1439818 [Catenaria anguillulae PL171]
MHMPGLASILDFSLIGLTILNCLAQLARTRPRPGPSDGSMDSPRCQYREAPSAVVTNCAVRH